MQRRVRPRHEGGLRQSPALVTGCEISGFWYRYKQLRINAPGNGADKRYNRSAKLNGRAMQRNWLGHDEPLRGATFDVDMSGAAEPAARDRTG